MHLQFLKMFTKKHNGKRVKKYNFIVKKKLHKNKTNDTLEKVATDYVLGHAAVSMCRSVVQAHD